MAQGEDPHFNDLNNEYPSLYADIYPNGLLPHQLEDAVTDGGASARVQRIRVRNSRGSYDTFEQHSGGGSTSKRNAHTASQISDATGKLSHRRKASEMKKAEHRLRTIEAISKYREEKIKREFMKLEEEMNIENEKQRQHMEKEERMKKYFQRQKERLEGYR